MLTGLMVLNFFSRPRITRNIAFVVEPRTVAVQDFVSALRYECYIGPERIHAALRGFGLTREKRKRGMFNVIHQESVIRVDCMIRKNPDYARCELERRKKVRIAGFGTEVVSKEDLMLAKLWSGRDARSELQLNDVRSLLATPYDEEYMIHRAKKLGLNSSLEECRRG
jgi:hypothetical protein